MHLNQLENIVLQPLVHMDFSAINQLLLAFNNLKPVVVFYDALLNDKLLFEFELFHTNLSINKIKVIEQEKEKENAIYEFVQFDKVKSYLRWVIKQTSLLCVRSLKKLDPSQEFLPNSSYRILHVEQDQVKGKYKLLYRPYPPYKGKRQGTQGTH